jgi:hypothetical protein
MFLATVKNYQQLDVGAYETIITATSNVDTDGA